MLALRGSSIVADVAEIPGEGKRETEPHWRFARFFAEASLSGILPSVSKVRDRLSDAEQAAVAQVRANVWRCDRARLERLRLAAIDKRTFDQYTDQASRVVLSNKEDRFLSPAQWADLVCGLRAWVETARRHEDDRAVWTEPLLSRVIEGYGPPREHTADQVARLAQFWQELQGHPNAVIAAYGQLGGLVNELAHGNASDTEARRRVRAYRLRLQEALDSKEGQSRQARVALYLVARHAFHSNSRLKMPGRFEEFRAFCEAMLSRNEVFPPLARLNADLHLSASPQTERDSVYAYDFLQRCLSILDARENAHLSEHGAPELVRDEKARFRTDALQTQAMLRAVHPALAARVANPWEKVVPLIDVYRPPTAIGWLQQPVVREGSVYLTAVSRERPDKRHDVRLLRVPLAGGSKQEGQAIALDLRRGGEGPRMDRELNFGITACVVGDHYYLGTRDQGILAFPLNGKAPQRIGTDDGLPSDAVRALAGLGDRLYYPGMK